MGMTDIELFDRAVYDYLTTISPRIVYAPTNNAKKVITKREEFNDKKPWNFISFYRDPTFEIDWSRMNNPATVQGDFVRLLEDTETQKRTARYVNNIPVNLTYNIDIWATKVKEVLEISISLIQKLYMQEQVLFVPINPDGEDGRFHILNPTWVDNSDIERETEIGKIYRHTISFQVDGRIKLTRDVATTRLTTVPVDIYENI